MSVVAGTHQRQQRASSGARQAAGRRPHLSRARPPLSLPGLGCRSFERSAARSRALLAMGDSSASDSSALSKHEVQHEDYRRLTAQALMVREQAQPGSPVCAR